MQKKEQSIFRRIFFPVFLLLILQAAFFVAYIYRGGVIERLDNNAYDILAERVTNRKGDLEIYFNLRWKQVGDEVEELNNLYRAAGGATGDFFTSEEIQKQFLADAASGLITMLRQNGVNGAFIILNNAPAYDPAVTETAQTRLGLSIRDMDQNSNYTDTTDLQLDRAPASLSSALGISLESFWMPSYVFEPGNDNDYYYKPLQAAAENPGVSYDNLAYFAKPHHVSPNDKEMISYSVPLIDSEGVTFGVLGVEISTEYIGKLLPSAELGGSNVGAYVLAWSEEDSGEYQVIATDGNLYNQQFGNRGTKVLKAGRQASKSCWVFPTGSNMQVYGSVSTLKVYNKNTPFESSQIVLMGLMPADELLGFSRYMTSSLLILAVLSLLVGLALLFAVSYQFAKPITRLTNKVREMTPEKEPKFDHVGVREIDYLVDALGEMSRSVAANRAKTEFLSHMSHDMRTPMNAIIGFSDETILEDATPAEKDEYLQKINTSGKYLLGLINDVLDMSKIESNRFELHIRPEEMNSFFTEIDTIIHPLAERQGLHFEIERDTEENCYVKADRLRMRQVFINLLNNAVKFTPEGGTVRLISKQVKIEDGRLYEQFMVQDNGIGMSEKFLPKMFDSFTQEDDSDTGIEGTGLGLAIVKNLITEMGGTIGVKSKLGEGTTFTVDLSFEICEPPAEEAEEKPAAAPAAVVETLAGKRVLLCEDHPLNAQIATKLLEKKGLVVDHAQNGKLGLEMFEASEPGHYNGILMDVKMPVMDGLQATQAIRALDRPDAATIPIIAMTANAFEDDKRRTREAGMNEHLAKPIEPQLLYDTLESYLCANATAV